MLILFLTGCESKRTEIKPQIIDIPPYLLAIPKVDTNREIKTQTQTAIFLLDIYEAYNKCVLNLKSIKKLSDNAKANDEKAK